MEQVSAPAARAGWTVSPPSRSAHPQGEMRPVPAMAQSPKGLLSVRKVSALRPASNPSCSQRSGTGTFPGIGPPGTTLQGACGVCRTTRTLLFGKRPDERQLLGTHRSGTKPSIEGRSFRSACSLFPVACASRLGFRPFIRRALDPQSRACRRSRRRTQRREPSRPPPPGSAANLAIGGKPRNTCYRNQ
jgi:hypothetical protein